MVIHFVYANCDYPASTEHGTLHSLERRLNRFGYTWSTIRAHPYGREAMMTMETQSNLNSFYSALLVAKEIKREQRVSIRSLFMRERVSEFV